MTPKPKRLQKSFLDGVRELADYVDLGLTPDDLPQARVVAERVMQMLVKIEGEQGREDGGHQFKTALPTDCGPSCKVFISAIRDVLTDKGTTKARPWVRTTFTGALHFHRIARVGAEKPSPFARFRFQVWAHLPEQDPKLRGTGYQLCLSAKIQKLIGKGSYGAPSDTIQLADKLTWERLSDPVS